MDVLTRSQDSQETDTHTGDESTGEHHLFTVACGLEGSTNDKDNTSDDDYFVSGHASGEIRG